MKSQGELKFLRPCDFEGFFPLFFLSCPNITRLNIVGLRSLIPLEREMKFFSLAGGMLVVQHDNGGNSLLLWSNASHCPDLAAGHVLARSPVVVSSLLWGLSAHACWGPKNGWSLLSSLSARLSWWSRQQALACWLPPRMCLTFLLLLKVCLEMMS